MNRIAKAFENKAFIPFITGGDPNVATTEKLLYALYEGGADIIEIGIPFSDPVAEGSVIEAASARALLAGCTADLLFDMVARVRADIPVAIVFMTYYNPVYVYGAERFIKRCVEVGVDGIIVPDLPFAERDELYLPCKAHGLELISLIAPNSTDEIVAEIARGSSGFLYCVSSMGTTGVRESLDDSTRRIIEIAKVASDTPCAVGFGISTAEQAEEVVQFADGVIVGSAIVQIIAEKGEKCIDDVREFARSMKERW